MPAVLLLAGSGPTDRNGDSALLPGSIGTLRHLADVLERKGFASLRYDKFGSGVTGLGPYSVDDVADLALDVHRRCRRRRARLPRFAARGRPGAALRRRAQRRRADRAVARPGQRLDRRTRPARTARRAPARPADRQIDAQLDAVVAAGQLPVQIADELRSRSPARSSRSAPTAPSATLSPSRCATPGSSPPTRRHSPRRTRSIRGCSPHSRRRPAGAHRGLVEGHPGAGRGRRRARRGTRPHPPDVAAHDTHQPRPQGHRRPAVDRRRLRRRPALLRRVHVRFRGLDREAEG